MDHLSNPSPPGLVNFRLPYTTGASPWNEDHGNTQAPVGRRRLSHLQAEGASGLRGGSFSNNDNNLHATNRNNNPTNENNNIGFRISGTREPGRGVRRTGQTGVGLTPGTSTIELRWYDYSIENQRSYGEDVAIP